MAEALLALLLRQSLVLSLALPLFLLLLRPLLLRLGGAGLAYAGWALLPLLLLVASLPGSAPARVLVAEVWAEAAALPRLDGLPLPRLAPAAGPAGWLVLWACGVLAGVVWLSVLHIRYVRSLMPGAESGQRWAPAGSGPALLGWLRPQLVLPLDFAQRFSPHQQTLVRCHESVHQQRHDNTWNLLATGLCLLHWFNPLAWWALRRMRADQELACDAAVMTRHPGSHAAYGHALLQAQGSALPAGLPWASWPSLHPLTERIAMLKRTPLSPIARRAGGLLLLLLGLAGAGAVHAWRAGEQRTEAPPAAAPEAAASAVQEGMVDLAMELSVYTREGDSSRRTQTRPRMRLQQGEEGKLIMHGTPARPTPEQVVIKLKAVALSGGRWQLDLYLAQGLPLQVLGQPRLIVMEGEPGRVELGDPASRQLSLEITARRASGARPAAVPAKT